MNTATSDARTAVPASVFSATAGAGSDRAAPRRFLEPVDRVSETLFGLLMVLTFTGSLSVADAGRDDVRTMLIGSVGCNLAWGIIDALLYLMGCLAERGQRLRTLWGVRGATDPTEAHRLIAQALPPAVASVLDPRDFEKVRVGLKQLPEPPARARLGRQDWMGGVAVFLWVFLSTFPVVIPFLVMQEAGAALRVSNVIAVVLLFITGYAYGRCANQPPWFTGIAMVVLGSVLVSMTMALGG